MKLNLINHFVDCVTILTFKRLVGFPLMYKINNLFWDKKVVSCEILIVEQSTPSSTIVMFLNIYRVFNILVRMFDLLCTFALSLSNRELKPMKKMSTYHQIAVNTLYNIHYCHMI